MASREDLEDALRNADAAGDAEAARMLADALSSMAEAPAAAAPTEAPAGSSFASGGKAFLREALGGMQAGPNYLADLVARAGNSLGLTQTPTESLPSARSKRFREQLFGTDQNPLAVVLGRTAGMLADPTGYLLPTSKAIPTARLQPAEQAEQTALATGYKLPPAAVKKTPVGDVMEVLGGPSALFDKFSRTNQDITDDLIRRTAELRPQEALTPAALSAKADEFAAAGYQPIRDAALKIRTGDILKNNLAAVIELAPSTYRDTLRRNFETLSERTAFKSGDLLDELTKMRGLARDAARTDPTLGRSYSQAAGLLERTLDAGLATSAPGLVPGYQAARRKIAQVEAAKDALIAKTGHVSADRVAKMADADVPLTEGLDTIAQVGANYKPVTKVPGFEARAQEHIGAGGRVTQLGGALALLGTPFRQFLGSNLYQSSLRNPWQLEPVEQQFLKTTPANIYDIFGSEQ